jgi:hypothetical protein
LASERLEIGNSIQVTIHEDVDVRLVLLRPGKLVPALAWNGVVDLQGNFHLRW